MYKRQHILQTDPDFWGTANYSNPNGFNISSSGHFVYDMLPYYIIGNVPEHVIPKTFGERFEEAKIEALGLDNPEALMMQQNIDMSFQFLSGR